MENDKELLESFGFIVGKKDEKYNPGFGGKYMFTEIDGAFCIVGDDLQDLMDEAILHFDLK